METRARDLLVYAVGRPLLLVFWCLVFWGTAYGLVLLYGAATEGLTVTAQRALSGRDPIAGIANLALAGLAAAVWMLVGAALLTQRRPR